MPTTVTATTVTPSLVVLGELPDLPEAIGRLAASHVIEGLADRRLLAIALLSRVQSTPTSALTSPTPVPVDDSILADALNPIVDLATYPGTQSLEARSTALLDIVRRAPSRSALVRAALAGGLISQSVADQIMAPLIWTVVPSTEAGGPAVAFETRMRVEATPVAAVEAILDPTNWTGFIPPWCKMTDLGGTALSGFMRCLEVIALDCAAPPLLHPAHSAGLSAPEPARRQRLGPRVPVVRQPTGLRRGRTGDRR